MVEMVQGEPIRVGERELVPVVRVRRYVQRQARVGSSARVMGRGRALFDLRPVAVLERGPEGERRIPIHDRTRQLLGGLLLTALIVPLLLALAVHLTREK